MFVCDVVVCVLCVILFLLFIVLLLGVGVFCCEDCCVGDVDIVVVVMI